MPNPQLCRHRALVGIVPRPGQGLRRRGTLLDKEVMPMSGTRMKPGRLGPYVDGYRARLLALGYTPSTVRGLLKTLGQLGRWMASQGLGADQLNASRIEAFLATRRADGHRRVPTVRSFVCLLDDLREEGVIGLEDPRPSATEPALDRRSGVFQ